MKKILISTLIIAISVCLAQEVFAVCEQCPQIQKQIKKEVKLSKKQKLSMKKIKKDMKAQIKDNNKQIKKNQRKIDKILKADCPDIYGMVKIKNENSNLKNEILTIKKETYAALFDVYTSEQKYTVKRILSENTGLDCNCDFSNNRGKMQTKCKKCKKD